MLSADIKQFEQTLHSFKACDPGNTQRSENGNHPCLLN
jgi:hypothetical protein